MIKATANQTNPDLNTRSITQGDTEIIRSPSSQKSDQAAEGPVAHSPAAETLDSKTHRESESSAPPAVAVTRLDAITGQWTIFAPDRTQRPDEFRDVISSETMGNACPFCSGNESETPRPVWVGRNLDLERLDDENEDYRVDSDATDWSVRVVPNKYPAVTPHESSSTSADSQAVSERPAEDERRLANDQISQPVGEVPVTTDKGLFQSHPNIGGHEVIIESPRHLESFEGLDRSDAALVFLAYRDRIRFWREQAGIRYISVFKNAGPQAGASLSHSHSQLIATSHLPSKVANVARTMNRHQAMTGCCLQCDLIRGELKAKSRVVTRTDSLIAFCPFASRLPMLVRITTVEHRDRFETLPVKVIEELSHLLARITTWIQQLYPGVSYNYVLKTRPPGVDGSPDAHHWNIEIFPRLTQMAGFEWGSHSMINPILPEVAAAQYRSRAAAADPRVIL